MTVCTASLFAWNYSQVEGEMDPGPAFVVAADRMMTDPGLGIEYESSRFKGMAIGKTMIFVSGDFTFHSEAIGLMLKGLPQSEAHPPEDVANALSEAIIKVRMGRAAKRHLLPLGLDEGIFSGQQPNVPPELVLRLSEAMHSERFDVEALVVGCIDNMAGLYRIDDLGVVTNHIDIGFLSIGIGGIHASAQFMFEPFNHAKSYFRALYSTFVAKKRAEVAPGVGPFTDMFRITRDGASPVPEVLVSRLAQLYDGQRKALAKAADRAVAKIFQEEQKLYAATQRADGQQTEVG